MELTNYLYLAAVLFAIGAITVLTRRSAIIAFMGVELMLNAANLTFVTFARMHGDLTGQVVAFFVMVVAAAEVVVGLAIIAFMGVELMLNAANLTFVTFARMHGDLTGQVVAFFVMVVAAAEVVVGLAIIVAIFRTRKSSSVDDVNLLKG